MKHLLRFLQDEDGPTAVEYAVMLALIMAVCLVSIGLLGSGAGGSLVDSSDKIDLYINHGGSS